MTPQFRAVLDCVRAIAPRHGDDALVTFAQDHPAGHNREVAGNSDGLDDEGASDPNGGVDEAPRETVDGDPIGPATRATAHRTGDITEGMTDDKNSAAGWSGTDSEAATRADSTVKRGDGTTIEIDGRDGTDCGPGGQGR